MTALPEEARALGYELADLPDDDDDLGEQPTVPSFDLAQRYSRALRLTNEDIDTIHATARAEKERIDAWVGRRTAKLESRKAWLIGALEHYARSRWAESRTKSIGLIGVTLKLTKGRAAIDVRDPDAFVAWAGENAPELLSYPPLPEPKPDKRALAKLTPGPDSRSFGDMIERELIAPGDGEIIPGVFVMEPAELVFKAVFEDDEDEA